MTYYNDGRWHGWNNDRPMPTHPRSRVQCVTDEGRMDETDAALVNWNDSETPIRAFRVTRVAREPREFWLYGGTAFRSFENAKFEKQRDIETGDDGDAIIHVREVQQWTP